MTASTSWPAGYEPFSDTARPKRRAVSTEKTGPFHHLQNTPSSGGSHRDNGRFQPVPDSFPPVMPFSGMIAKSRRSVRHIPDNPDPAAFMRPSRRRKRPGMLSSGKQYRRQPNKPAPPFPSATPSVTARTIQRAIGNLLAISGAKKMAHRNGAPSIPKNTVQSETSSKSIS